MTTPDRGPVEAERTTTVNSGDPDSRKGPVENGQAGGNPNAPALDDNGLPNDEKKITEDAVGAREDETQG